MMVVPTQVLYIPKFTRHLFVFAAIIVCFISKAIAENESSVSDSIHVWKNEHLKRSTWEVIGETTGEILYFPFKLPLIGVRESIRLIDDSKIIQKMNDLRESDDGKRKLDPIASPTTGFGLRYNQRKLFGDLTTLSLAASAWEYRTQTYEISVTNFRLFNHTYLKPEVSYSFLSTEPFFGIGPSSRYSDISNYSLERTTGAMNLRGNLIDNFDISARFGIETTHSYKGYENEFEDPSGNITWWSPNIPPLRSLTGADEIIQMTHLGLETGLDTKNHIGIPSAGIELKVSADYFDQVNGDDYRFWQGKFDFTKYTHIAYKRVIVLRAGGEFKDPLVGDFSIPFYYLSSLGGTGSLRGFTRDRFYDKDAMFGSLEYRYPLRSYWDKSGLDFYYFADGGKVMEDIQVDYKDGPYQIGFGFGLRTWNIDAGETMKIEFGFSRDGYAIEFVMGL